MIPRRRVTQIREMYQQRLESLLAVDEGVERILRVRSSIADGRVVTPDRRLRACR